VETPRPDVEALIREIQRYLALIAALRGTGKEQDGKGG
jgi:hypothetical protein